MICQSCGRANELEAKFCKGCGAPLASDEGTQQNNSYQPGAGYQTICRISMECRRVCMLEQQE